MGNRELVLLVVVVEVGVIRLLMVMVHIDVDLVLMEPFVHQVFAVVNLDIAELDLRIVLKRMKKKNKNEKFRSIFVILKKIHRCC